MQKPTSAKFSLFGVQPRDERRSVITALTQRDAALTGSDVRQLRRALFEDEAVSRDEAIALFALEQAQRQAQHPPCAEWTAFFIECLTDHVVWQARPTGIISNEQAEWLSLQADAVNSLNSFALLANVLAEAHRAPQWFVAAVRARAQRPAIKAALERARAA
jgi:hypothetical protein